MERGRFERLVKGHLDPALLPRAFRLTPQRPADADVEQPSAVYEADRPEFTRRFPKLAGGLSNAPCVDFWVHLNAKSGELSAELEGHSLEALMQRLGISDSGDVENRELEVQLEVLAKSIAAVLDAASVS